MKESKGVYVTKRDIKENLLNPTFREYQLYSNKIIAGVFDGPNYGQQSHDVGVQYDSKRDNLICTCRNLNGLKRHHEARYFNAMPKQIYTYHRSRSFTDIGVGSVKALQKKKVKRVYLPETDDRGVGSSDLSSFIARKPKHPKVYGYYDTKRTSSKCVGGLLEINVQGVISAKVSPIIHTKSGTTSPNAPTPKDSLTEKQNTEIGSNTVEKELVTTTTQIEQDYVEENVEESQPVEKIAMPEPIVKIVSNNTRKEGKTDEITTETSAEKRPVEKKFKDVKSFSSDSLVQHVHNLENPSQDKPNPSIDPMENKLEREYRKIFDTKSKEAKGSSIEKAVIKDFKSASLLRRRFDALRRTLGKKEDSRRNIVLIMKSSKTSKTSKTSSQESVLVINEPSHRDASVTSDPPSLEGRSYSNTRAYRYTPYSSANRNMLHHKDSYKKSYTGKKDYSGNRSRANAIDSEYAQGVKGMFKLWGKKFNLDEDYYRKAESPKTSFEETKVEIKEPEPSKTEEKPLPGEKKEGKKFFFFKKKTKDKDKEPKEKPKEAGPNNKQKKGVTAGRCEVRDGLMIKIGAAIPAAPPAPTTKTKKVDKQPESYSEISRKAWLMKYLTNPTESRNSVQVRWNNKTYTTSSSTVFELMENVYKETGVIFKSKSEILTEESSYYKSYTKENVNFVQNVEAWMIPKLVPDNPLVIVDNAEVVIENKNDMEVTISDQKWLIEKSKAFAHKIEVVLHSKNIVELNNMDSNSEYLKINIPKGFFSDSSSDDPQPEQTSDEEVYKIVEYETIKSSFDLKKVKKKEGDLDAGDHLYKDIKVTISVKDSKNESKILETIIKRPPMHRDVVTQGSTVYIPKKCDVIGVGIITQRDIREVKKPILKFADYESDDDSDRSLHSVPKKCEFAESYLQDYCRNWTPLGVDLFSWCMSDSHVKCCSENNSQTNFNNGDTTKSCPDMYDEYTTSPPLSSCPNSSCSQCLAVETELAMEDKSKRKDKKKAKDKESKENTKKSKDKESIDKRVEPKDSLEVLKKRKLYAKSNKAQWKCCHDKPDSLPSFDHKGASDGTECLKKKQGNKRKEVRQKGGCGKHVSMAECDMLGNQPSDSIPGILTFKGSSACDWCKKKGHECPNLKHVQLTDEEPCEIPDPACRSFCLNEPTPACIQKGSKPCPPPIIPPPCCRKASKPTCLSQKSSKPISLCQTKSSNTCPPPPCPPKSPPCQKNSPTSSPACPPCPGKSPLSSPPPCSPKPQCPGPSPPRSSSCAGKSPPSSPPCPPKPPCPGKSPPNSPPCLQERPCPGKSPPSSPPCPPKPQSPGKSPPSPGKSPPSPGKSPPSPGKSPPRSSSCPGKSPPRQRESPPRTPPSPRKSPPGPRQSPPRSSPCAPEPPCSGKSPPRSPPGPRKSPTRPRKSPPRSPPCLPKPPCSEKSPPRSPPCLSKPPCSEKSPPNSPPCLPKPPCPAKSPVLSPPPKKLSFMKRLRRTKSPVAKTTPPCLPLPSCSSCQKSSPVSPPKSVPCVPKSPPSRKESCCKQTSPPRSPPHPKKQPSCCFRPGPPPCAGSESPPSPKPPQCCQRPQCPLSPPGASKTSCCTHFGCTSCEIPSPACSEHRSPSSSPPKSPPCPKSKPCSTSSVASPSLDRCYPGEICDPTCDGPTLKPSCPPPKKCCPPKPAPCFQPKPQNCPRVPSPPKSPQRSSSSESSGGSPARCMSAPNNNVTKPKVACVASADTTYREKCVGGSPARPILPRLMCESCKPKPRCGPKPPTCIAPPPQCSPPPPQCSPPPPKCEPPPPPPPPPFKRNSQCGVQYPTVEKPQSKPKLTRCNLSPCRNVPEPEPVKSPPVRCSTPPCKPLPCGRQSPPIPTGTPCPPKEECMKQCPLTTRIEPKKEPKLPDCIKAKAKSPIKECPPAPHPTLRTIPSQQQQECPKTCRTRSKITGLYLKKLPSKKKTCSRDCMAWDEIGNPNVIKLNSKEKITIRLREGTPSTEEIRHQKAIKIRDEDGKTICERKDYVAGQVETEGGKLSNSWCKHESGVQTPHVPGVYKGSNVSRLTAPFTVNNVKSIERSGENVDDEITKSKSDVSIANLIEINFKLRVSQGDKMTEINIGNDQEKKKDKLDNKCKIGKTSHDVFVLKDDAQNSTVVEPKNDINIRILIKNFKPEKSRNVKKSHVGDFSDKISEKFQTVSTGYDCIDFTDEDHGTSHVFSVHRATIDLTASPEISTTHLDQSVTSTAPKLESDYKFTTEITNSSIQDHGVVLSQELNKVTKSDIDKVLEVVKPETVSGDNIQKLFERRISDSRFSATDIDESEPYYINGSQNKDLDIKTSIEHSELGNKISGIPLHENHKSSKDPVDVCDNNKQKSIDVCNKTIEEPTYTINNTSEPTVLCNKTCYEFTDIDNRTSEEQSDVRQKDTSDEQDTDIMVNTSDEKTELEDYLKSRDEEKKQMLKQVFENANYLKKPKTKTRIQKLKNMLKAILTSDSSDPDDIVVPSNELAKDITYECLKPNFFKNSDSLNNYYRTESTVESQKGSNIRMKYPTEEINSVCSGKNSEDWSEDEAKSAPGGCLCSALATRLNISKAEGGGCCCRKKITKNDQETVCDIRNEDDYFLLNYNDAEFVDVEVQNSKYSRIDCANISITSKTGSNNSKTVSIQSKSAYLQTKTGSNDSKTASIRSKTESIRSKTASLTSKTASIHSKELSSESKDYESKPLTTLDENASDMIIKQALEEPRNIGKRKKTFSPRPSHMKECEMKKLNTCTKLGINDEDKIVFLETKTTKQSLLSRSSSKYTYKHNQNPSFTHTTDVLQLYETKKAVLEIYAEKTETEDGERTVAKLPKFTYDRENEMYRNYEKIVKNSYKTLCKRNIVMMSIRQ